jgi:hypothetical protein
MVILVSVAVFAILNGLLLAVPSVAVAFEDSASFNPLLVLIGMTPIVTGVVILAFRRAIVQCPESAEMLRLRRLFIAPSALYGAVVVGGTFVINLDLLFFSEQVWTPRLAHLVTGALAVLFGGYVAPKSRSRVAMILAVAVGALEAAGLVGSLPSGGGPVAPGLGLAVAGASGAVLAIPAVRGVA